MQRPNPTLFVSAGRFCLGLPFALIFLNAYDSKGVL
jgi:hypothetical protein